MLTVHFASRFVERIRLGLALASLSLLPLAGHLANRSLQPLHSVGKPLLLTGATPRIIRLVAPPTPGLVREPALALRQLP